jgi:hypothetical protein
MLALEEELDACPFSRRFPANSCLECVNTADHVLLQVSEMKSGRQGLECRTEEELLML